MCGITGIFSTTNGKYIAENTIVHMMKVLRHRGPDGVGIFKNANMAMGHRRLSIIDLSDGGQQPFYNEDQSLVLVFNGEIYNYKELKIKLLKLGHQFSGCSDGEIILHLYEEEGVNCVKNLEGMFAFALYDIRARSLYLARDRTGEKPLYYTIYNNAFFFASELKSFCEIPGFIPEISKNGIVNYFSYTQSPAPYSMYEEVYKVIPGHYLIISEGEKIQQKCYWQVDYSNKINGSFLDAEYSLNELLLSKVGSTLSCDVPVGISLSGGIDSSVILGMSRAHYQGDLKSFTLGRTLEPPHIDPEFVRAKLLADKYTTDHHTLELSNIKFGDFKNAIAEYDEPIGLFDVVHSLLLSKFVGRHIKVMITGNGADEVFGGYSSYHKFLRETVFHQNLINIRSDKKQGVDSFLYDRVFLENCHNAKNLFAGSMREIASNKRSCDYLKYYFNMANYESLFDGYLFFELMVSLNHTASLSDLAGMNSSIEQRSPFLNHNVIEFSANLPVNFKIKKYLDETKTKFILKEIAKRYMPEKLIYLKKYGCGYFINYEENIRTFWKKDVEEILFQHGESLSHIFSASYIKKLWSNFSKNRQSRKEYATFIKILIFFIWHKYAFEKNQVV